MNPLTKTQANAIAQKLRCAAEIEANENNLFLAVLCQAVSDATFKKSVDISVTENAAKWLAGGSRGFKGVCHLAGLEHEYVSDVIRKVRAATNG